MASSEPDVLAKALALPADERARIAHELIVSLDDAQYEDAAEAWAAEIERRAREVESGAVEAEDWSAVRARLTARFRKP